MEEKIGRVTHYFNRLGVAAVEVEHGRIRKGDHLHIVGHTTDTEIVVDSLEIEHTPVIEAGEGQSVGLKVSEHVREHDDVYKSYI